MRNFNTLDHRNSMLAKNYQTDVNINTLKYSEPMRLPIKKKNKFARGNQKKKFVQKFVSYSKKAFRANF